MIAQGDSPWQIDGHAGPALFRGDLPLWRSWRAGIGDGADVAQLEQNLADLGFGTDLVVDEQFDKHTTAAIKAWQDYIAVANNDLLLADAIDNEARMYYEAGDSLSVPAIYKPLIADPTKYGELSLVHAGVVATRNGHPDDAIKLFNAALAQNPYSRDAINNLAATYIQNKEYSKAFPLIDKLVSIDPSNPDNPLLYAFAYQGLYKGTKDKKLQKIYTDSLVYFNNKSENAPVKVLVTEFTRRPDATMLGGTIENRGTTAKTYTLNVDLLDKSGAVVSSETATVGPVAPKKSGAFKITTAKGGVYGYRYKPIT